MRENKKLYKLLKIVLGNLLKILYRPKVIGLENIPENEPLIFAGNHKHAVDPVVVMANVKPMVHYMAKHTLFKGLHGKMLESIGIIKVNRSKSNPMAILEAQEVLKNGGAIGIFPEGTRNKTNEELLKFRHGAVSIAKKTGVKIIPFAIRGEYKLFRKGLIIEFGKPLDFSEKEIDEANNCLRNEVLSLLRKN